MSHPPPHTSAHENDSTLETKHQQQQPNENCDQKQRASSLPRALITTSLQRGGPTKTPTLKLFQQLPGPSD